MSDILIPTPPCDAAAKNHKPVQAAKGMAFGRCNTAAMIEDTPLP